jgi:hypothetical protein
VRMAPSQTELQENSRALPTVSSAKLELTRKIWIASFAAFAVGVVAMLMYRPFSQAEHGDDAIWDYVAQCIVRGQIPYRDVIEIKSPGSAYLSAMAIVVGKAAGLQDIVAMRVLCVLLVGILCAVICLTAYAYFRSTIAGLTAVLILVMSPEASVLMIAGTRPKVPMIIFGLLTLLLIAGDKPFWAGFCSMLSCLCWQPGLMFTAAAVLVFSRYLTSWRDLRALKVLIGASVPLVLVLIYFYCAGALADFWTWTVSYNYQVYWPETSGTVTVCLNELWYLLKVTSADTVWVKLGVAGFLLFAVERIWVTLKSRRLTATPDLFKDALAMIPLAYVGFRAIEFPGRDDLIPLFPFIGLFAGFVCIEAIRLIGGIKPVSTNHRLALLVRCIPGILLVVLTILTWRHCSDYQLEGSPLQEQQMKVQQVAELLEPDDKIYVHGVVEILVLLNRPNMNKYIFLDRGKDRYIADRTPGGFGAIMDEMKAQTPKVIAISRIHFVAYRQELLSWAAEQYDQLPVEFARNSVYVRKPQK